MVQPPSEKHDPPAGSLMGSSPTRLATRRDTELPAASSSEASQPSGRGSSGTGQEERDT